MAKVPAPKREPLTEELAVFRFMKRGLLNPDTLAEELCADGEVEETKADKRERKYPELLEARSVFAPEPAAKKRWCTMRNTARQRKQELSRPFVAEIRLGPDDGLDVERRGQQGHMLLWGEKTQLAAKVVRTFDGWPDIEAEER